MIDSGAAETRITTQSGLSHAHAGVKHCPGLVKRKLTGPMAMEKHVIGLERRNLAELEAVERLAATVGAEVFEADVMRLSRLHTIAPEGAIQAIRRLTHPSIIGMSDPPFQIFQRLADELVEREPSLQGRPSYRCRGSQHTALPYELWLSIVRHSRDNFDPAAADAEFLVSRLREGLTSEEAFFALIASKRYK